MTTKSLRKTLARLNLLKSQLPGLIDCSKASGDGSYTKDDIENVDHAIELAEKSIKELQQDTKI